MIIPKVIINKPLGIFTHGSNYRLNLNKAINMLPLINQYIMNNR